MPTNGKWLMQPTATRSITLTLFWFLWLGLWFRWWDLTLKIPGFLLWTLVFIPLFLGTAFLLYGPAIRERRREVWKPTVLWLAFIVVALIASAILPAVHIRGQAVSTVVFSGVLDLVLPLWIFVRTISLLWKPLVRATILVTIPPLFLLYTWVVMVQMPGSSFSGPFSPLSVNEETTRQHLEDHVRVLAAEIGERNDMTYAALDDAATYIDSVLTDIGFDVASQQFDVATQTFRNLEATLPGEGLADEIIVVGGHYDAVEGSPGANDNASGTAAVLELARLLSTERFARTIRFVAFANEEPPFFNTDFMGSRAYAERSARSGENIVAMISLETIGFYSSEPGSQRYPPPFSLFYPDRGDFIGFVGNPASRRLVRRCIRVFRQKAHYPSQGVAAPSWIPGVNWSDHASFWLHGYQAIMISDTAPFRYPHYHTKEDTADKLDYSRMARVVIGVAHVLRELAQPLAETE